jgi:hypothetical protein
VASLREKQSRHDTELVAGKFTNGGFGDGFWRESARFFACEPIHGARLKEDWLALKSFTVVRLYNSA